MGQVLGKSLPLSYIKKMVFISVKPAAMFRKANGMQG